MRENEIGREIQELRSRIERLERHLAQNVEPLTPPPLPPAPPSESVTPARAAPPMTPPTSPPVTAPPLIAPPVTQPGVKTATVSGRSPVELLIGGKVAAWVGALVIVAAGALLIQLGWGWLSPIVRCLLIAGCGGLLVIGGEFAIRKAGRAASVGLFGAGLGVLYLDAFAASSVFDLVSREWAFVFMAVVAMAGFACTLRTKSRTIGVLSLIGGYATPVLLSGSGGHDLEVLAFITMLFGVALALSAVRPSSFRALRFTALGLHAFVAFVWLVSRGQTHWVMGVIFLGIWWTMLVAECVIAALREQTPRGNAVATLLGTAGFATGGCWILGVSGPAGPGGPMGAVGPDWLGTFTTLIAILGTAVAFQFGSGLDALRARPRSAMDKLAVALWAQSGALLTIAVALQFDGFAQGVSWLVIGVAAIEIGRRLPSRGADVFGLSVWALSLVYLNGSGVLVIGFGMPSNLGDVVLSIGDVELSKWGVLGLLAVALSIVAAFRLRAGATGFWRRAPFLVTVVGAFLWLTVCAAQVDGLLATALWLAGAAALLVTNRMGLRQRFLDIGLLLLLLTAARWMLIDTMLVRMAPSWRPGPELPLLNAHTPLVAAIVACGWWATRIVTRRDAIAPEADADARRFTHLPAILFGMIGLIGLWFGSFEIDRALAGSSRTLQTGLSVYWALYGSGLIVAGFVLRTAFIRYAGLALLTVTVIKIVVVDLATVERVWRVVSFFVSGLLLVGISILYTKLAPRFLGRGDQPADP